MGNTAHHMLFMHSCLSLRGSNLFVAHYFNLSNIYLLSKQQYRREYGSSFTVNNTVSKIKVERMRVKMIPYFNIYVHDCLQVKIMRC